MRTRSVLLAATAATALGTSLAAQQTTIPVSETGAQVRVFDAAGEMRAAVSRDGGSTWIALPEVKTTLNWRTRSFDPLAGDPGVPSSLKATSSNELFYVQFVTDIIPEYATAMERLGADVTRYYPNQAYIVRISRDKIAEVRDQPYVRAVMEVDIGHKLDTDIQIGLEHGVLPTTRYNIMMVDKHRDTAQLESAIEAAGGVIEMPAEGGIVVEATLTPSQLMAVAGENTVLFIDRWTAPEFDIDNARIQAGVNYVETMAGIDGKGVRGHINEGIFATHPEFAARPPYRTDPISLLGSSGTSHGTNTAGEIYAQGLSGGVKGILPYAQLLYSPNIGGNRYAMVQTLQDASDVYKALMMTQSWGGSRTTSYTTTSALLDDILFDFDHIFATNSQSNAGARPSRPEAWAKNVAGIGGFLHRNNTNPADDCWCFTGSIGPAQDGRVGVTFAAYYDSIRTTAGTSGYTNGFGGTSGATPIVNGLSGAAIQMFTDGLLGYPGVPWDQRFGARPNLTTTRVMLAATTRQLAFPPTTNNAERIAQGWGFPNVQDLYDLRDNILLLDEEDVLTQGQTRTYWVWVKPGTPEFRASMHHLEDEAVPSAIPTRINSLDLSVVAPSGANYWGNDAEGTKIGPFSKPGGSANDIDIHENVILENPSSGLYQVNVTAAVVRADNHKETPGADVDFALAIRGIGGGRDKSGMVLDMSSSAPKNLEVSVSNVPGGWTAGFTMMSFDTDRHLSLGNVFGMEFDNLSNNIISIGPKPGGVFAFTNSANPAHYPNATFVFPPNVANAVSGMTIDGVVVLFDGGGNLVDVSNVARVTVQ